MVAETSTLIVRAAEARDVRDIRAIDAQVYPTPWSEKLTIDQVLGAGTVHLVVEDQHRVIGHAAIVILDGDAHISTIAVDPGCQRRGIGDVLMRHLFAAAEANSCSALTLEVRVGNTAAIALYERHGMTRAGVRPGYYGDNGEDAAIYWSAPLAGQTATNGEPERPHGMETDAQR